MKVRIKPRIIDVIEDDGRYLDKDMTYYDKEDVEPLNELPEGLEEARIFHEIGFKAGAEWGARRGITITTDEPSNKTLEIVEAAMWSLVHSGVDKIIIQIREK